MNKLLIFFIIFFGKSAFSQTIAEAQNLAEVMSGAREKINEEIPKDKYGRPAYHIGNLGGVPVHLPQGVDYLEYNDSPGWDIEAIKNYDPDKRTYDSVIESFGFEFRNSDLVIYDVLDPALRKARKNDYEYRNGDGWVKVSVKLMPESAYSDKDSNGVTRMYQASTSGEYLEPPYPAYTWHYERLEKEDKYGLKVYINPGIDPKTKKPWREDRHSEDLFISL